MLWSFSGRRSTSWSTKQSYLESLRASLNPTLNKKPRLNSKSLDWNFQINLYLVFVFDQNFQLLYLIPRDLLWRWAYKTKIIVLIVLVKCLMTSKAHWNCCLAFANGSVSNKNWILLQNKKKMKINIRERLGWFFFSILNHCDYAYVVIKFMYYACILY